LLFSIKCLCTHLWWLTGHNRSTKQRYLPQELSLHTSEQVSVREHYKYYTNRIKKKCSLLPLANCVVAGHDMHDAWWLCIRSAFLRKRITQRSVWQRDVIYVAHPFGVSLCWCSCLFFQCTFSDAHNITICLERFAKSDIHRQPNGHALRHDDYN